MVIIFVLQGRGFCGYDQRNCAAAGRQSYNSIKCPQWTRGKDVAGNPAEGGASALIALGVILIVGSTIVFYIKQR